jgi:MFS family permease
MNKGLRYLLMSDFWAVLALSMIGPIYAIFVERIGGDILEASTGYFAFMFTSAIAILLIGRWTDRKKNLEKFIFYGYALNTFGCLMYLLVDSQQMFVLTQIVLGLGVALKLPAYDALYSIYLEEHKEATEWGYWEALQYFATALAAIIGGIVVKYLGFKILFVIMSPFV